MIFFHANWLLILISVLIFWGCAGVEEGKKVESIAIRKLKLGEIKENVYINNYYKCEIGFNSDFTPWFGYPQSLVRLEYKDNISKIELFARKTQGKKVAIDGMIKEFIGENVYTKIREKSVNIGGIKGKEITCTYVSNNEPFTSLLYFLSSKHFDYVITFYTKTSLFDGLKNTIRKTINGFRITDIVKEKRDVTPVQEISDKDTQSFVSHKVSKGESLSVIAMRYTGSYKNWKIIAAFNSIDDPTKIRIGQVIKIPKKLIKMSYTKDLESKEAEVKSIVEQTKPEKKTVPEDISAAKQPDIGVGIGKIQQKKQTFSVDIVASKKAAMDVGIRQKGLSEPKEPDIGIGIK